MCYLYAAPSVSVQQLDPHHSHSRDLGDLRSQNMDIEGIVRSEMKKLLQVSMNIQCQYMYMDMYIDTQYI